MKYISGILFLFLLITNNSDVLAQDTEGDFRFKPAVIKNDISNIIEYDSKWYPDKRIDTESSDYIILKDYKGDTYYSLDYASNWIPMNNSRISAQDLFNVDIYPNPAKNDIMIEMPQLYSSIQISIYDLNGKLMISSNYEDTQKIKIDVSSFLPNIYTIVLNIDGISRTFNFLIVK